MTETLAVSGIITILAFLGTVATVASAGYSIGSKSVIPKAPAINIGVGGALHGFTLGGVMTVLWELKTGQVLYYFTAEGGFAPISVFAKHQKVGFLLTLGFIWNMNDPSELSGWSMTATFPRVFGRLALPTSLKANRWAQIPLALSRYEAGVYKSRQGVIQVCQSASGPVIVAGGFWSYSFGWTVGYSNTPRPIADLWGDIADIVWKLIGALGKITLETSPEIVEGNMRSALATLKFEW